MKLREIFDQLTYGELSQVALGGAQEGFIDDANYNKMLAHVNLGLTALHTRFNLKTGLVDVGLIPGVYVYKLERQHAASYETVVVNSVPLMINGQPIQINSPEAPGQQYLLDSPAEPFIGNVLKVEAVYTDTGHEMPLNNAADAYSILTPTLQSIRVPKLMVDKHPNLLDEFKTDKLQVHYRANHPILQPGTGSYDANQVEVDLPYSHLEALLLFIASRIHNPIGMSNEFHAGNSYAAKYEMACQLLEGKNVDVDNGREAGRLERSGWV